MWKHYKITGIFAIYHWDCRKVKVYSNIEKIITFGTLAGLSVTKGTNVYFQTPGEHQFHYRNKLRFSLSIGKHLDFWLQYEQNWIFSYNMKKQWIFVYNRNKFWFFSCAIGTHPEKIHHWNKSSFFSLLLNCIGLDSIEDH